MKTIAITGATGTFGKTFLYKCLSDGLFSQIIAINRDEYKQYLLRSQLLADFGDIVNKTIKFWLADVRDKKRLSVILQNVDFVIHAAALKHINACEVNPYEAIRTNIIGTQNLIEVCTENSVSRAVFLCTDKGVDPINLYGYTKACAEKLVLNHNLITNSSTTFSVVRYGNVIGSRGSVIPYMKQIKQGEMFTLTDPDMTRFWLTAEEAVRLSLYALENMKGQDIFVPKLKSLKMRDLIKFIAPHLKFRVVGKKPGEKQHESMISKEELCRTYLLDNYCYVIDPAIQALMPVDCMSWKDSTNAKPIEMSEYTSDMVSRFEKDEFLNLVNNTMCLKYNWDQVVFGEKFYKPTS